MLSTAVQVFGAQLKSATSWDELASHQLALGGVWVLFDAGDITYQIVTQIRTAKQQAFWGILILGQAPASEQQPLISNGADAYLAYPFDLPALKVQITKIIAHRAPVGVFNVLPPQIASGLDRVWARFEHLSYYDLLELSPISTPDEIQTRFHQRSLVLHPDRHRGLKRTHPPVYDRVNLIYKRLLEAYRVLTDDLQRPLYDAALVSGLKRWNYILVERKKEIMNTTEHPEAQVTLARALSMRSRGLLKVSCQLIERLCQQEPDNASLKQLASGSSKLLELARRDPQVAEVIDQQIAPEGLL
jgi:CheY-like chemotaxis protein